MTAVYLILDGIAMLGMYGGGQWFVMRNAERWAREEQARKVVNR